MENLSDRLDSLRGNLTQKQMALRIGVPLNTYTNWIRGINVPRSDQLQKICTVFGVSADWLLGLSEKNGTAVGDRSRVADLENRLAEANHALDTILKSAMKVRGKL